jgi:hypothetical protein
MATVRSRWTWTSTGVIALGAIVLAVLVVSERRRPRFATPAEENAVDLARRLAPRLGLQVVRTSQTGPSDHSAYLVSKDRPWGELNGLSKSRERIANWRGTIYCERSARAQQAVPEWEGCSLRAGPFIFFGDPELLAQVPQALADTTAE